MRVTLPWPPLASSPNGSQGNFRAKASAGRGYKWDAHICCKRDKLRKVTAVECVTITFHKTDLGNYDLDNMLARIKRGLDAIATAIGVDDGKWQEVRLRRGHVVNGGAVVVEITDRPAGVVMLPVLGTIS